MTEYAPNTHTALIPSLFFPLFKKKNKTNSVLASDFKLMKLFFSLSLSSFTQFASNFPNKNKQNNQFVCILTINSRKVIIRYKKTTATANQKLTKQNIFSFKRCIINLSMCYAMQLLKIWIKSN